MYSFKLEIKNIGSRLILSPPREIYNSIQINKGESIKLILKKEKETYVLFSKYNRLITLTKECINHLNLKRGEVIQVTFEKLSKNPESDALFSKGKIDLLFLMPKQTSKNSQIVISEIIEAGEHWLLIKSFHNRGSSSLLKLRRFLDLYLFGCLLGQIQSEGTKSDRNKLEFCNKSIKEHIDFIYYLEYLGISRDKMFVKLDYFSDTPELKKSMRDFERLTKLPIDYLIKNKKSRGGFGFKLIVRSTILAEIFLSNLDFLRREMISRFSSKEVLVVSNGFLSKLLNGDGSIYLIKRGKNIAIQARLSISDGNYSYLQDYSELLKNYGLKPHINKKWGFVRSYLNENTAKKIFDTGAFKNNPNHIKLKTFIAQRTSK